MYEGWSQVARLADLAQPVCAVDLGTRRLVAVTDSSGTRVFDGTCPHRGAHLGHGATLEGQSLRCPFHGHRVDLGPDAAGPLAVREFPSVSAAGGLFVLLRAEFDTGLDARLRDLERSHVAYPALDCAVPVPPPYVIENAVDADHFVAVHGLTSRPRLSATVGGQGTLEVSGDFHMARANQWQGPGAEPGPTTSRFAAQIFSPTIVVSELGPAEAANVVVTAATPTLGGGCHVRVTVALPRQRPGRPARVRDLASLVSGTRTAFEQDTSVWAHLDTSVTPTYLAGDELVRRFHDFCHRFAADG